MTETTWRELLQATGRTPHVNNLGTLLRSFEEMRSVSFRVFQGDFDAYEAAVRRGRLLGAGFSDNLVNRIDWSGVSPDSRVTVRYGGWVKSMFKAKSLVSRNGDVYFRLKSDYAKSFWPSSTHKLPTPTSISRRSRIWLAATMLARPRSAE